MYVLINPVNFLAHIIRFFPWDFILNIYFPFNIFFILHCMECIVSALNTRTGEIIFIFYVWFIYANNTLIGGFVPAACFC